MSNSFFRIMVLATAIAAPGCKKPTPEAAPATVALAPAAPADPKAAKAANKLGMKHYRKKNFGQAATAFRAALAADPSHLLAHYNLACVLALSGDAAGATAELEWLAKSPEPQAARQLAKAGSDGDLAALAKDQKVKALIEAAAERALFPGFVILARGVEASPQQAKQLDDLQEHDDEEPAEPSSAKALTWELASDSKGSETLVASGVNLALFDGAGVLVAEGTLRPLLGQLCTGRDEDVDLIHLWVGQVVADPAPEIVLHVASDGSMSNGHCENSSLVIFKRNEKALEPILTETTEEYCTLRNDSEPDDPYANPDSSESHTDLELRPDGSILRRDRGGERVRKTSDTLRWNAKKFAYVTDGAKGNP